MSSLLTNCKIVVQGPDFSERINHNVRLFIVHKYFVLVLLYCKCYNTLKESEQTEDKVLLIF